MDYETEDSIRLVLTVFGGIFAAGLAIVAVIKVASWLL